MHCGSSLGIGAGLEKGRVVYAYCIFIGNPVFDYFFQTRITDGGIGDSSGKGVILTLFPSFSIRKFQFSKQDPHAAECAPPTVILVTKQVVVKSISTFSNGLVCDLCFV